MITQCAGCCAEFNKGPGCSPYCSDGCRFWSKVDKSGPIVRQELGPCWLYRGKLDKYGYGRFMVTLPKEPRSKQRQKNKLAHRCAWEQEKGPLPPGVLLLHKCDVRQCCRPDHMFKGDQADNIEDMVSKGRHAHGTNHPRHRRPELAPRGEDSHFSKLTEKQVREIFARSGESVSGVARDYGVAAKTVRAIWNGRSWNHITGMNPRQPVRRWAERPVEIDGESLSLKAACRKLGANYRLVYSRVYRGWDPLRSMQIPPRPLKRRTA